MLDDDPLISKVLAATYLVAFFILVIDVLFNWSI